MGFTLREIGILFGYDIDRDSERKAEGSIQSLKSMATKALGAIGIGFSLVRLNAVSEEFSGINDQIRRATAGLGEQSEIQQKILASANATRTSYEEAAEAVSNLLQDNGGLFADVDEAVKFNNAATMLFKSAGKTNEEISGLMESISQSFAEGAVDSETIGQLLEGAPEAAALLNERLGTTAEQLEEMVSNGAVSLEDLKGAFLDNADAIAQSFGDVRYNVTDALLNIRNQWGLWVADMDESLGITEAVGTTMVKAFTAGMGILQKFQNRVQWMSEKLGGVQNLFKLIGIIAAAALGTMAMPKALSFLAGIKNLDRALLGVKLKIAAIVAVIVLITLLIEDFINFMQGNDSLLGSVLEKAGVDVDKFRNNIIKIWENIKTALSSICDGITNVAIPTFKGILEIVKTVFGAIGKIIERVAPNFARFIEQLAGGDVNTERMTEIGEAIAKITFAIAGAIAAVKIGTSIAKTAVSVVKGASSVISFLTSPIGLVILAIAALIAIGIALWKNWDKVKETAVSVWNSIKDTIGKIKASIVEGFTAAIDWITSLPAEAFRWGKDIIKGIVDGIKSGIGAVSEAVSGVASKIRSFLHFSEPDEGPLRDFHTYMPDMIGLMAAGITEGRSKVKAALEGIAGDMSVIAKADVVSGATAQSVSGSAGISRSVVQNVNINNQFNGDRAGQKKSAEAMERASDDATDRMARALAFAR